MTVKLIVAIVILSILFLIASTIAIVFFFLLRNLVQRIKDIEDKIQIAIEDLDSSHNVMNDILNTPLFFDSPQIKRVLNEIDNSRKIVLDIIENIEIEIMDNDELDDLEVKIVNEN